ncbi:MAG: hypothetical protein JW836_09700 [Deltaproteobacteria bacterium]|nr:hypothetical protein [Deltaproteobacteria bacterium]
MMKTKGGITRKYNVAISEGPRRFKVRREAVQTTRRISKKAFLRRMHRCRIHAAIRERSVRKVPRLRVKKIPPRTADLTSRRRGRIWELGTMRYPVSLRVCILSYKARLERYTCKDAMTWAAARPERIMRAAKKNLDL